MDDGEAEYSLWTAPEVLKGQWYNEASDIFSFGMLMVEVRYGLARLIRRCFISSRSSLANAQIPNYHFMRFGQLSLVVHHGRRFLTLQSLFGG